MSDWLGRFLIGTSESNIEEIGRMKSEFSINVEEMTQKSRDVRGDLRKVSLDKIVDTVKVRCSDMTKEVADKLLQKIINTREMIYLKVFENGKKDIQYRLSSSRDTVKLTRMSRRFITIESVVLASEPAGTNYYSGGNYDEENYIIHLGTPLPEEGGDNQEVIVRFSYRGWKGVVDRASIVTHEVKETGLWKVNFTLEGV